MPHLKIAWTRWLSLFGLTLAAWAIAIAPLAQSAQGITCNPQDKWIAASNAQQINQLHIFCGESQGDRISGLHSRPNGQNPPTVAQLQITQPPNAQGIYGVQWRHRDGSASKFSTFFPDRCSKQQVLNSIAYAATHPITCPATAPRWAWCGRNSPRENSQQFCQANNGTPFAIAGARLRDGRINTAFPIRQ